jgi:hypothetical protein
MKVRTIVGLFAGILFGLVLAASNANNRAALAADSDTTTCYPKDGRPFTCGPVSKGYHCCEQDTKCCH